MLAHLTCNQNQIKDYNVKIEPRLTLNMKVDVKVNFEVVYTSFMSPFNTIHLNFNRLKHYYCWHSREEGIHVNN